MNKKEIIEGLKDLQMHSGNIVFSQAIQALENKPSIKELKAEFRARNKWYYQYLAGEISIGKFCDLLAEAIYNFRRGK